MKIAIDYYLKQDGVTTIMHTEFTEQDLFELLEKKFKDGDLPCPLRYNREKVQVKFEIDKITV